MRLLISILFLFLIGGVYSQQLPQTNPITNAPQSWISYGYTRDSAHLFIARDTFNSRYPAIVMRTDGTMWRTLGNGAYWYAIGGSLNSFINGGNSFGAASSFGSIDSFGVFLKSNNKTIAYLNPTTRSLDAALGGWRLFANNEFDVNDLFCQRSFYVASDTFSHTRVSGGVGYAANAGLPYFYNGNTTPVSFNRIALYSDIPSVSGYVPYSGATNNLALGSFNLTATAVTSAKGKLDTTANNGVVTPTQLALKVNKSDSGIVFATPTKVKNDSTTIMGYVNGKVNYTDTSTILSPYQTALNARVKYTDSTIKYATPTQLATKLNKSNFIDSLNGRNATLLGNTTTGSGSTIVLSGSPTLTLPNIAAVNVSGGILSFPTGASGTIALRGDTTARYTGFATLGKAYNDSLTLATAINGKGVGTITGVTAGIDLTGGGTSGTVTLNADTTTGATKLATQGYVGRNLPTGTLSGNGTPSGQLMPFSLWSSTNSKLSSSTVTYGNYDSVNHNFNFGTTTPQSSYLLNASGNINGNSYYSTGNLLLTSSGGNTLLYSAGNGINLVSSNGYGTYNISNVNASPNGGLHTEYSYFTNTGGTGHLVNQTINLTGTSSATIYQHRLSPSINNTSSGTLTLYGYSNDVGNNAFNTSSGSTLIGTLTSDGVSNHKLQINGYSTATGYIVNGSDSLHYLRGDGSVALLPSGGSVTSVSTTSGLGITSSVATSTTTPNISIAVDTSNASILSRQRASSTYVANSGLTSGQVAFSNGSNSITSSGNFAWNNSTNLLTLNSTNTTGLIVQNTANAPSGGYYNSPIVNLKSNIWNSASGSVTMQGGLLMTPNTTAVSTGYNQNPTSAKLSFQVATDNNVLAEKMYVTSEGLLGINGGANLYGTTSSYTNDLTLTQGVAATSGTPVSSNRLIVKGAAWNSVQGSKNSIGYMQMINVTNNANPTTDKLSFFVGSADVANGSTTGVANVAGNGVELYNLYSTGQANWYNSSSTNIMSLSSTGNLTANKFITSGSSSSYLVQGDGSTVLKSSVGGLTGSGTVSSALVPLTTWSTTNTSLSNTNISYANWDTTNHVLNLGTNTAQSTYLLNVNGRSKLNGQVSYGGSAPTISAGTGAGTSPTVTISGTNNGGIVNVTTGTLPSASATIVTVTYTGSFATGSEVILYPANAATALLSGVSMVYTSGNTTTFTITAGTTALTASTAYSWNYQVTGY